MNILTAEQVMAIAGKHQPDYCSDTHVCFDWQAIADELNAKLGSGDDYEAKMDALLCRLTNGKWSKSRAYDLDFMVSCIDEEYEKLYEKECAMLGSGTCEYCKDGTFDGQVWMMSNHGWQRINCCPNCGRRMKGGEL